jgi:hypothetical protein
MGAIARQDDERVGGYRKEGTENNLGMRAGRGESMVRADAVVAVFSGDGATGFISVY